MKTSFVWAGLFLFMHFMSIGQQHIKLESSTLASTSDAMPFWLTHNQLGKFKQNVNFQQYIGANYSFTKKLIPNIKLLTGTQLAATSDHKSTKLRIIEAYTSLQGRLFKLSLGSMAPPEQFEGLSSTNGNFNRSRNARPYPKLSLESAGYIPAPVFKERLSFAFTYEEGYLYDNRYIDHARLHYGRILLRYKLKQASYITAGYKRYIFWGGTQPNGEKLPSGLGDYFRYIFGEKGGDQFLETDQLNVAGNTLGIYHLSLEKSWANWDTEIRIQHPFEDHSGMEFENYRDNFYMLYLSRKQKGKLLDAVVLEYLCTKNQSGDRHQITGPKEDRMHGMDNYFNHGVYRSGFSFMGYSMGTPLFGPINGPNSSQPGFINTRVSAWHLGAKGFLSNPQLSWQTLISYTHNWGTYFFPFDKRLNQWYTYLELGWHLPQHSLELSGKIGADFGDFTGDQLGFGLSFRKAF